MLGLPIQTLITIKMEKIIQKDGIEYLQMRKLQYDTPPYNALNIISQEFSKWQKWEDVGGRWTTRFAKLLKTQFDYKLPAELRATIGETLKRYMEEDKYVVISPTIDWPAGNFGDAMSCWFGDKPDGGWNPSLEGWKCGRVLDKHPDAYAIKIYRNEASYQAYPNRGTGRCWAYVLDGGLYLFNLIGGMRSTIANAFAYQLGGLPVQKPGNRIGIGWDRQTEGCYYIGNGKPVRHFHWEKFEEVEP